MTRPNWESCSLRNWRSAWTAWSTNTERFTRPTAVRIKSTGCVSPTPSMFLPSLNLAYTDRASMAASTEVRVPFVDKQVFEAAFAIPGSDKIVGRERKAILKEACSALAAQGDRLPAQGPFQRPTSCLDPA